ncbi:hypothetical protein DL769_006538 [Monosporascus sp. CRB-8-3]|nr:hypothetical protein DL769_006538 [Monosporascus sp. CRB-8-3]
MEQDQGTNHENAFSFERNSDQNQLDSKYHLAIHKCFQKPTDMDLHGLQQWYEEYNAADGRFLSPQDPVIQEVQSDELDRTAIEKCIAGLAEEVPVTNGFCDDCQGLFDNWPDLSDPESKDPRTGLHWPGPGADWKHAVARDCHTLVLEAAARNGCRFCAFLVQAVRDTGLLDTVRRIEARLEYIGNKTTASLSVQNWGTGPNQLMWVNFPGKVCDHCNGGVALDMTFDSAALEISAKIPAEELPKTVRDAIHITRELGLEYLWVDSLCIIQGYPEDWRREASLMSSVYGGSFINIAAASAVNVHQGCFLKPPHLVDGLRASITVNGSKFVRDFRSRFAYDMSTIKSHLATRAWAFQEKILPSRTIHFGNRGAFWECRAMTANEFLPDGFPHDLSIYLINNRRKKEHFGSWWSEAVRLYSAANLTYSQDKLPSLSGIARHIHHERGGQYLAGMWREEKIEAQLCWRVTDPRKRPPWRAPSWSWVSVNGRVMYHRTQSGILDDTYAHVVDAEVTSLGDDPFGEVSGGWLRIGCSGMLAAQFSDGKTVKIESEIGEMSADGDFPVLQDCLDDGWEKRGGTVYLLPLLGGRSGLGRYVSGNDGEEGEHIDEMLVCGILLRSTGGAAGQFYRIGMFNFWRDQWNPTLEKMERGFYDAFLRAFEQGGKAVAERVQRRKESPLMGSSVATALASGLVVLIIHWARLRATNNHYSSPRDPLNRSGSDSTNTIKKHEAMEKALKIQFYILAEMDNAIGYTAGSPALK